MAELSIPRQRTGRTECVCGQEIHLVNRALGPLWVHAHGSDACGDVGAVPTTRATPAGVGVRHG